jgi:hypothetical protein
MTDILPIDNVTPENLSDVMEFDRVIQVCQDGSVVEVRNLYAPNVYTSEISPDHWELEELYGDWMWFTYGYTGQHGYNGPEMHSSEYIGGRLARDILETPGIYCAVEVYPSPLDDTDDSGPESWGIVWIPPSE